MDNNEASFHEIINNQSKYTVSDCLEALLGGVGPEHIKTELLTDCIRDLGNGRRSREKSQIEYLLESAIEDDLVNEKLGSERSSIYLDWAINHVNSEADDNDEFQIW